MRILEALVKFLIKIALKLNFSNTLTLKETLSQDLLLPAFKTFIVEAAKECAEVEVVARSDLEIFRGES
jgi:hypothetical protein